MSLSTCPRPPRTVDQRLIDKIARTSELPDDNSEIPTTLFTRRLALAAPVSRFFLLRAFVRAYEQALWVPATVIALWRHPRDRRTHR